MMALIQKQTIRAEDTEHPLLQLGLACAAALFVAVLLMTYGLDLSPGLILT
jgi:hypothetical protein